MAYLGKTPSQAVRSRYYFTASGGETSLSGTDDNSNTLTYTDGNYVDVSLNGVALVAGSDYNTTTANTIGGLTALTASDVVEVVVYDTFSVFSGAFTGDISLGDNVKAKFGASNDLQIYHNGTNSYIDDAGTGALLIRSNEVRLNKYTGEYMVRAFADGAVELYHDNSKKLATTSTGIDVTGDLAATGHASIGVDAVDSTRALTVAGSTDDSTASALVVYNSSLASKFAVRNDGLITGTGPFELTRGSAGSLATFTDGVSTNFNFSTSGTVGSFGTDAGSTSLALKTSGSERIRIDSSGKVAIGTTSTAAGQLTIQSSGNQQLVVTDDGSEKFSMKVSGNDMTLEAGSGGSNSTNLIFKTASSGTESEAMRITSSGNVGIGATNPNRGSHDRALLVSNTATNARSAIEIEGNSSNANGTIVFLNNGSRSCTIDSRGTGTMTFNGASSEYARFDSSGRIGFAKTPDGSAGTVGVEIGNSGDLIASKDSGAAAYFNRNTSDGIIVYLMQAGTAEGNISVSGTTVTYNGGHLGRWSQATDGNRIDGLVKGTVMTNLDQMAEWTKDGVTEDNEQLNCMAVSSVEGDANVAGVFVNWDDDDTDFTADMIVAMTGDMVIRIAQGTTVARGDLLMSAGDGTAKPQGDDIVRSKTIAKVTSTNVSHTYDDGSYLVPCVLMAC